MSRLRRLGTWYSEADLHRLVMIISFLVMLVTLVNSMKTIEWRPSCRLRPLRRLSIRRKSHPYPGDNTHHYHHHLDQKPEAHHLHHLHQSDHSQIAVSHWWWSSPQIWYVLGKPNGGCGVTGGMRWQRHSWPPAPLPLKSRNNKSSPDSPTHLFLTSVDQPDQITNHIEVTLVSSENTEFDHCSAVESHWKNIYIFYIY